MLIRHLALAVLMLSLAATGIAVAWSRHESRQLFQELEALNRQRDDLNTEWNQLQVEQGMLTEASRVEFIAREQLGLGFPKQDQVRVIAP